MKNAQKRKLALTAMAIAFSSSLLAGCGGGGGGGSTATTTTPPPSSSTNSPVPATPTGLTTPQYATGSAELAMFNQMNAYRQQCGFPAVQENTLLDQAAVNHVSYMQQNGGLITDNEVSGNPGFTGVTYMDRAVTLGWPSAVTVGGGSSGYYTNATLTDDQYGKLLIDGYVGGVYHQQIIAYPVSLVGFGFGQTPYNGYPNVTSSVSLGSLSNITTGAEPLSFPCQGTTGLSYSNNGEAPVPPATSGPWGTPVTIMGNPSDAITLSSGTMTDPNNNVIPLHLLDSGTDPNNVLAPFTAVAYPTSPLAANTTYTVNITGTMNGSAFVKNFSFTTGN